jgi:thiol:disulfide interchange protein DsbC
MILLPRITLARVLLLGLVLVFVLTDSAVARCPTKEEVSSSLNRFAAKGTQIITVKPTAYAEICEVHVRLQGGTRVFYVGSKGDFFLMGQLYDAATGNNLTRDSLDSISLFSMEEMAELRQLTAFSLGSSNNVLYYITDPQCPYCKRGAETLKKMAEVGEIQVNFLLFPLKSHQGAKEQSVAVICDNKSLEDFDGGYHSDNQCDQGVEIIEKTIRLLDQKGITGTPTYIFPDRRYHSGVLDEAELRRRLGLGAPTTGTDNTAEGNQ